MPTAAITNTPESDLDFLLADLGLADEPDATAGTPSAAIEDVSEIELEAAVGSVEAYEAVANDDHKEVAAPLVVDPLADPSVLMSNIGAGSDDAPVVAAPEKKEKKAKEPKPPKEKKAKETKEPVRKHYASVADRVTDKMGAELGSYSVLELADADLEGDALKAKQNEMIEVIKSAGTKVQKRIAFLMEYAAGKSATLNHPATLALTLLHKDGQVVTGEKGNYFAGMSEKYSKASANAMGNNTLAAMKALKMLIGEKGTYKANPESLYLIRINGMLGLA